MRRLRAALPVLVAIGVTWWLTTATAAQTDIPAWSFVRDGEGQIWLVGTTARLAVPIYSATEEQINAIGWNGKWVVPKPDGLGVQAGAKPEWATDPIGTTPPSTVADDPTATPVQTNTPRPAPTATSKPVAEATATAPVKRIGDTTSLTAPSGLRLLVTVNDVDDNMKPGRYDTPAEGRYVTVDWTIKNDGTTDMSVNRLDFKLQTADDFVIQRATTTTREPDLTTARLGPGQTVRGWLTYDVPKGARLKAAVYQPSGARQFVIADLSN